MFKQARIRLTAWYLIIIMVISLAFSGVIYRSATLELDRFARAQQMRFENRVFLVKDNVVQMPPTPLPFDETLLSEARLRILRTLLMINLGILSMAFVLGYYLSGKTLEPIADMMDEQYRFVSDASHELKTPLTAIKSTLEVALRNPKTGLGEARQALQTSLAEVNDLQKLTEGLLELSGSNHSHTMKKVRLDEIVRQSIKTIEPLASARNIAISTALSRITIMAESESLRRAIITILDNAIKYSKDKTKITVSVKVLGTHALLRIKDQGIGIAATEMPQIFNRFYRSDKARSTDGYGLGLSIAKKIVEAHKGTIDVQSQKDKGTTVSLLFPYSARIQH
jgi:two-component system sensor histidine kinase CiaH